MRVVTILGVTLCLVSTGYAQRPRRDPIDIPLLIELHNQQRAEAKLPPLSADPLLEVAAKAHAKDMGDHATMTHIGSDGSKPAERIERAGYKYMKAGENVAAGQKSSREVVKAWMNSPHHKENILGDYTQIGAACYVTDDGDPYWCVTFGKPWPKVDLAKDPAAFIDVLNKEREKAKLGPLKLNDKLTTAASRHARAMAKAGKLLGTDDEDKTPIQRAMDDGYAYSAMSGTASMGDANPEKVVKSLLSTPQNSKALLGDFQDVGVGLAANSDGIPFWSILLGSPPK